MPKVKNLFKNTPSKLYRVHQRRSVLRMPSNIEDVDFCKNSQGPSVVVFAKDSIPEVWTGSQYVS